MATPTGQIAFSNIAAEIGRSTANISLNSSDVRQLAGKSSGQIAFSDLRGKTWSTIDMPTSGFCSASGTFSGYTAMTSYIRWNGSGKYNKVWFDAYNSNSTDNEYPILDNSAQLSNYEVKVSGIGESGTGTYELYQISNNSYVSADSGWAIIHRLDVNSSFTQSSDLSFSITIRNKSNPSESVTMFGSSSLSGNTFGAGSGNPN